MREVDYVARYGGEEFLVMLPDTDIDGAIRAAERIRERLAERAVVVGNQSVTVTLSVGVAEFPIDGDSPESLIVSADAALYQAKRHGRDRVVRASRGRQAAAATAKEKKTKIEKPGTTKKPTTTKKPATKRKPAATKKPTTTPATKRKPAMRKKATRARRKATK